MRFIPAEKAFEFAKRFAGKAGCTVSAVDLGPLGRCGREAKEQKNGQQWDVED